MALELVTVTEVKLATEVGAAVAQAVPLVTMNTVSPPDSVPKFVPVTVMELVDATGRVVGENEVAPLSHTATGFVSQPT